MLKKLYLKIGRLFGITEEPSLLYLEKLLGFEPKKEEIYELALTHKSMAGELENNERLEYLGDTVLDTIVSEYLYYEYPDWTEGRLSQTRSDWVKRKTNNLVARKLKLENYIHYNKRCKMSEDMLGNCLEALIGAIFLDQGYDKAKEFFYAKVLPQIQDLEKVDKEHSINYKMLLNTWAQRNNTKIHYNMLFSPKHGRGTFRCAVEIQERTYPVGTGRNMKLSQQNAAKEALLELEVISQEDLN